jgi:hypothetical protein
MSGHSPAGRQGELFATPNLASSALQPLAPVLLRSQLLDWQGRVGAHQGPLFQPSTAPVAQGLLFDTALPAPGLAAALALDPLALQAQSLSFWRWPSAPQQGAAIYLVLDRPEQLADPLLLYVGETGRADRRWKGDHDCKSYLAAYTECLQKAALQPRLSIRFWCDVPTGLRERRALEQGLIRHWLPPFNKETRDRWTTPFTADLA